MRLALCSAVALALAGCDNPPPAGEPGGPIRADQPADADRADGTVEDSAVVAGDLPPQGPGPRFVGQWAANQQSCQSNAWQFTETTLRTPAGSVCSFNRVTDVPGGYDIQATCTAEAPPTSDTLRIRFAESADSMVFESESIADTGLVYCGREA